VLSAITLFAFTFAGPTNATYDHYVPPVMTPYEEVMWLLDIIESREPKPVYVVPEPWASLADCESGDWLNGGAAFVEGSARWEWARPGTELPSWGTSIHHGGLQFLPATWTWVAPDVLAEPPTYAYEATPEQQVAVAEEVQRRQGWGAWPVCSRKVGLR